MFAHIYTITALIDERIGHVEDARNAGLGSEEYFQKMEKLIRSGLARLKEQSSNNKLIRKYENKVNELFKEV